MTAVSIATDVTGTPVIAIIAVIEIIQDALTVTMIRPAIEIATGTVPEIVQGTVTVIRIRRERVDPGGMMIRGLGRRAETVRGQTALAAMMKAVPAAFLP